MILLAMYGKARSGKDTAADYLAKELGLYKYAFAEPLKNMLKSVFGDHFHEGDRSGICPETGKSYREMMQTLGTEWGRKMMTEDLWINLVKKKWDWVKNGGWAAGAPDCGGFNGMILSDVRFDSEAEWVRSQGGIVIEIRRDSDPITTVDDLKASLGLPAGIPGHQSEAGIRAGLIDLLACNHGSRDDLYTILDSIVQIIRAAP